MVIDIAHDHKVKSGVVFIVPFNFLQLFNAGHMESPSYSSAGIRRRLNKPQYHSVYFSSVYVDLRNSVQSFRIFMGLCSSRSSFTVDVFVEFAFK